MPLGVWAVLLWGDWNQSLRARAYPIPQTQCASEAQCAQKAVQIQAREAAIAEAAIESAVFQGALSLAGLVLLGLTAYYAHKAWGEAERSAKAALDAYEADNRTWLAIKPVDWGAITFREGKPRVSVTFLIQNLGEKPAFDVAVGFKAVIADRVMVGPIARDALIEFQRRLVEHTGGQLTIVGKSNGQVGHAMVATSDPDTDDRAARFGGDAVGRPAHLVASFVYAVFYRTPASPDWRCSSGGAYFEVADNASIEADLGDIPEDRLSVQTMPTLTKMT